MRESVDLILGFAKCELIVDIGGLLMTTSVKDRVNLFKDIEDWGQFSPSGKAKRLLEIIDRLPNGWLGRRLALLLRKPIKKGAQRCYDRTIWGLRLRLRTKGNLSELRWLSMAKFHDTIEREALRSTFKPGSVFLDVGANVGFYSFWALANRHEGMRILSVEPSEQILESVHYNLALNDAANAVEIHQCALTDKPTEVFISLDENNLGESAISETGKGQSVPGVPLLQLIEEAKLLRVDAMKIDVEGYEILVMETFFKTAPRQLWPRMVVGEIIGEDGDDFTKLLLANDYTLSQKTKMNGIFALISDAS